MIHIFPHHVIVSIQQIVLYGHSTCFENRNAMVAQGRRLLYAQKTYCGGKAGGKLMANMDAASRIFSSKKALVAITPQALFLYICSFYILRGLLIPINAKQSSKV